MHKSIYDNIDSNINNIKRICCILFNEVINIMTITVNDTKRKEINKEVMLLINQNLFDKCFITEEMYNNAKISIIKS